MQQTPKRRLYQAFLVVLNEAKSRVQSGGVAERQLFWETGQNSLSNFRYITLNVMGCWS